MAIITRFGIPTLGKCVMYGALGYATPRALNAIFPRALLTQDYKRGRDFYSLVFNQRKITREFFNWAEQKSDVLRKASRVVRNNLGLVAFTTPFWGEPSISGHLEPLSSTEIVAIKIIVTLTLCLFIESIRLDGHHMLNHFYPGSNSEAQSHMEKTIRAIKNFIKPS